MPHSSSVIKMIKDMRFASATLGEIMEATGLSKTTIYHHIKDLPKTVLLRKKIKASIRAQQKLVADNRRGKSTKKYIFKKPPIWTPEFVTLVAHFMFDGEIARHHCTYTNRSTALLNQMIYLMNSLLDVDDYKRSLRDDGVQRVSFFNVEIANYIKEKSLELTSVIRKAPQKQQIAFLKAFYDDEGSVYWRNRSRKVRGYQYSIRILHLVGSLLKKLHIESVVEEKRFEISIRKKQNLQRFYNLINFSPGVCINGNRSNSIWKKSLEKRHILDMALASYQNTEA